MTDPVPSKGATMDQSRGSSSLGRFVQSFLGALFVGWLTEASSAEVMLMFMVLRLQLDNFYG